MKIKYKIRQKTVITDWRSTDNNGVSCKFEDAVYIFGKIEKTRIYRYFFPKTIKNKIFLYKNELYALDDKPNKDHTPLVSVS